MKYLRYKISTLKLHLFFTSLFSLASYPLFSIVLNAYIHESDLYIQKFGVAYQSRIVNSAEAREMAAHIDDLASTCEFVGVIAGAALVALFFSGFVIAAKTFRYLYNKDHADKELTLPVPAKTRILGDFFSGLMVYMVPHIVGILIGSMVLGFGSVTMSVANKSYIEFTEVVFSAMLTGALMCLEFYCMTVLVMAVCGRLRKVIILTLVLNIAVPAFTFAATYLSYVNSYGLYPGFAYQTSSTVCAVSPLGLLIGFFQSWETMNYEEHAPLYIANLPAYIVAAVFCIILAAAAYFLIMHRRHERTGNPYVFRYARRSISVSVILVITTVVGYYFVAFLNDYSRNALYTVSTVTSVLVSVAGFWIISTLLLYMSFEFSDKNKEKKLPKLAKYPLYLAGCAVLTVGIAFTQGFGTGYYVPAPDDIRTVHINFSVNEFYGAVSSETEDGNEDRQIADSIVKLHKEILSGDSRDRSHDISREITIYYTLKNGMPVSRGYNVNDEYAEKVFELFRDSRGLHNQYVIPDRVSRDDGRVTIELSGGKVIKTRKISDISCSELQAALDADTEALTYDMIKDSDHNNRINLDVISGETMDHMYIYIYPGFSRTLDFLEQIGFEHNLIEYKSYIAEKENVQG
ncbi:MAG: hypothetical protein J6O50_15990 [Ruminiclostridium sp.]|nr:hypothetical protein [Ruminiclostridium sp.]